MMLHYKLVGAVEVDIPEDKTSDKEYLDNFIRENMSDRELLLGVEGISDGFIYGDAIEVIATSKIDGTVIARFE